MYIHTYIHKCLKIGGPLCHETTCNKLEDQDLLIYSKSTSTYIHTYIQVIFLQKNEKGSKSQPEALLYEGFHGRAALVGSIMEPPWHL